MEMETKRADWRLNLSNFVEPSLGSWTLVFICKILGKLEEVKIEEEKCQGGGGLSILFVIPIILNFIMFIILA